MFEGRIKPKGYTEEGERPVLREMRWTDLVARLEANRDYIINLRLFYKDQMAQTCVMVY